MKRHPLFACAALILLSACSTFRSPDMSEGAALPIVSGFTPVAIAPVPFDFCHASASSDGLRAASQGFDTQTVERITANRLSQCNVLMAGQPVSGLRVASR